MLDSLIDLFDLIDRAEGWLAALTNVERGTRGKRLRKRGLSEIRVSRAETTGQEIEDYLRGYHIPLHGRRTTAREIIFSVPSQQAVWARHLLSTRGTARQPQPWAAQERR